MNIVYGSNKLEKQLSTATEIKKAFGKMAAKVSQRMDEIRSFGNLFLLMQLPAAKCHALTGNRKGDWAVSISGNHRLIFVLNHDPIPLKDDGSLDIARITDIKITGTEDYH